jgi:hypothetical protein
MPRFDKTGPQGKGPRSGRGLGPCGKGIQSENQRGGLGQGRGRGLGQNQPQESQKESGQN